MRLEDGVFAGIRTDWVSFRPLKFLLPEVDGPVHCVVSCVCVVFFPIRDEPLCGGVDCVIDVSEVIDQLHCAKGVTLVASNSQLVFGDSRIPFG